MKYISLHSEIIEIENREFTSVFLVIIRPAGKRKPYVVEFIPYFRVKYL